MSNANLVYNPYMPCWEYVPDGEPHVFGERLYVYGSHDRRDGDAYCPEDYVVWSAPTSDLSQWRFEGVSYRRDQDPYAAQNDGHMAAPDVAQGPDGRYYLFYCVSSTISVAVADAPAGPFEYLGNVHAPGSDNVAAGCTFDPAIYSGPKGNWLYYGYDVSRVFEEAGAYGFTEEQLEGAMAASGAYAVELEDDMLTCKGQPVKVAPGAVEAKGTAFEGHSFFEASSIRVIGGRWYLVYSSILGHDLAYAVADAPTGPFEYGGVIVSNADVGYCGNDVPTNYMANTHGGLVEVRGQWYVFYHRHTHKRQYSRQACAEPIRILPDGSIPQVQITSCGLNGGPLPAQGRYPAHIACGMRGPEGACRISTTSHRRPSDPYFWQEDTGTASYMPVENLRAGAELDFKYFEFLGSETTLALECRGCGDKGFAGTVRVLADDADAAEVAVDVPTGRATWVAFEARLSVPAGVHGLRLAVAGTGALDLRAFSIR